MQLITSASVNNMFAYGHWACGMLTRTISIKAVAGVWRDTGTPRPFEEGRPVRSEAWLDLANAALASALRLEGDLAASISDPVPWEYMRLHVFERPQANPAEFRSNTDYGHI